MSWELQFQSIIIHRFHKFDDFRWMWIYIPVNQCKYISVFKFELLDLLNFKHYRCFDDCKCWISCQPNFNIFVDQFVKWLIWNLLEQLDLMNSKIQLEIGLNLPTFCLMKSKWSGCLLLRIDATYASFERLMHRCWSCNSELDDCELIGIEVTSSIISN